MIRQLVILTWFISLSAADTRWKDLLAMLCKLLNGKDYSYADIDEMSSDKRTRRVQADPVNCVGCFDHNRVQTFINIVLQSTHNPLGKVKDFFHRVEFQIEVHHIYSCLYGWKMLQFMARIMSNQSHIIYIITRVVLLMSLTRQKNM